MENHTIKIGDIFVEQWGATMAMVTFYQVVGVKGKTTVVLHEIDGKEETTGFLRGYTTPVAGAFRKLDHNTCLLTRRVKKSKHNDKWCTRPREFSFAYPHEEGKKYAFEPLRLAPFTVHLSLLWRVHDAGSFLSLSAAGRMVSDFSFRPVYNPRVTLKGD